MITNTTLVPAVYDRGRCCLLEVWPQSKQEMNDRAGIGQSIHWPSGHPEVKNLVALVCLINGNGKCLSSIVSSPHGCARHLLP